MAKNGKKSLIESVSSKGRRLTTETPKKAVSLVSTTDYRGKPFLTFSFRYCTQQEYFGYAEQDAAWFANLQDRLKDLSGKTNAIIENQKERQDYRLHPIDWDKSPISVDDLKSVPEYIRKNAEDDFFWQFQLSKGTGRVVGFFNDEMTIFYIVLLDPKHNIQPSKDYAYRVDDTTIALTEYERIQMQIAGWEDLRCKCEHSQSCPLQELHDEYLRSDVLYASLDAELKEIFEKLIQEGDFQDKFNAFLMNEYFK